MPASLVVTVIGPDRPGLVSLLADRGRSFGASWAESRMASLAGQFAGIVHFQVPEANVQPLAAALRDLESIGLHVVVAESKGALLLADRRAVKLELTGQDQPGIIRDISGALAERGISIEDLHTEIVSGAWSGEAMFQVRALLLVPVTLATDELRRVLEGLANELMVDISLGDIASR